MNVLHRVLLAACVAVCVAGQARAQEDRRTIDVSGTSEIRLEPEFVRWEIELVDNDPDPVKAKAMNDERFQALLELTEKMDIEANDVIIGDVSIDKRRERNSQREYVFKGYDVERRIVIVHRQLDEFDEMLASLASFKAEFEISYGSEKISESRHEARLNAVAVARDKANAMAEVLGQKVGRPLAIEEREDRDDFSNSSIDYFEPPEDPNARFRSIVVKATVDIRFELLDD